MEKSVRIKVPATTANIGPGFDCLGMALDIWNYVEFTITDEKKDQVIITGQGQDVLNTGSDNLIIASAHKYFSYFDIKPPRLLINCENNIPVSRGLGSSSSAIIAGLLGAVNICEHSIDYDLILKLANEIEGHADNVAAALYGGCILVINDNSGNLIHQNIPIPEDLRCVLYIPGFSMATDEARNLLKDTVSRMDAVYNISRLGLLINALNTSDFKLLSVAMQDALHQPSRKAVFRGMDIVIKSAMDGGALGACLSGAGPTILAFTNGREITVTYEMRDAGDKLQLNGDAIVSAPSILGAQRY